jgi:hypothetical protein
MYVAGKWPDEEGREEIMTLIYFLRMGREGISVLLYGILLILQFGKKH